MSNEGQISVLRLTRFSAIAVPVAAAQLPLAVYLPAAYAQNYGIPLATIGFVLLLGRLWDAVIDPLIGTLSDRTRSRFGRRKPWIAGGAIVFGFASLLLYFPPFPVTAWSLGVVLFVFYLGWTAIQIPFFAWSGEVSGQYHERTRIATFQTVIAAIGLLVTLILPAIAARIQPGDSGLQLALMGGLVLATIVPATLLSLTAFDDPPVTEAPRRGNGWQEWRNATRSVFAEPLLLRVLASDFAVTLAQTIRGTLIVFFVTFYMGRPDWAALLFLFQFVFGVFAGPIWLRIGKRYGKHRTAVVAELVQVAVNLGLLLVTPETFGLLLFLTLAQGLSQGSGNLMLRAIVADVADKNLLETGVNRTGLYYSVFALAGKAGPAVAVGIALPLVAWLGFDPQRANDAAALNGLLLVFALGPAIGHAVSAALLFRFSLDEEAHREIRRRLDPTPDLAFAE